MTVLFDVERTMKVAEPLLAEGGRHLLSPQYGCADGIPLGGTITVSVGEGEFGVTDEEAGVDHFSLGAG